MRHVGVWRAGRLLSIQLELASAERALALDKAFFRKAACTRRHVRGFESEEIYVDYMQIRVKTGAVFSEE